MSFSEQSLPEQYRPLSPWAYFGLSILFSIPVLGFIFLIIFSISNGNINRRNFARSYWCVLVIAVVAFVIMLIFGGGIAGITAIIGGAFGGQTTQK